MILKGLSAVLAGAFLLFSLPGPARAQTVDVWGLQAYGDVCRISFDRSPVAAGIFAVVQHDMGCLGGLDNISGWSANNGGQSILLYTTAFGTTVVGRLDREANGNYTGVVDDGTPVSMVFMGQMSMNAAPTPQPPVFGGTLGGGSTEARACRRYYGTATCADPYDIGKPPMQNFRGSLETLTRMNVRFMRTVDSSIVGTIDAGMCVEVRDCMTGFNRDQLWCEVRVNDRTGWMLKEDADFVYSRNSCG